MQESCETCIADNLFDEMPNKKPKLQPREVSGGSDSTNVPTDRLSSLSDELLHHIMSFLRVWEVVRTCVLSRRWQHLWASAPSIDLRVRALGGHRQPPERFASFVYHFLLERQVSAPLDTLKLTSSPEIDVLPPHHREDPFGDYEDNPYSNSDVDIWIRAAIKRRARVIQLSSHPVAEGYPDFRHVDIISCHLKHLKISGFLFGDRTLRQLSSQCPSLEVLDLKKCDVSGQRISSTSLKSLAIVECSIREDLTIATPNLISLRCITPHYRAPSFENLGSIAMATIVLDNSFLYFGYRGIYKAIYADTDRDSDSSSGDDPDHGSDADSDSDASTSEYSEIMNEYEDEQYSDCDKCYGYSKHDGYNDFNDDYNYNRYDSNHRVDRSKILGGHNVIHSLANATSLELLADAGEAILNRELKTCPIFINLKTLSLGEWSMGDDFNPLVFFLQHTLNLERLFLELKLYCGFRKTNEDMARPEGKSFGCTHLKMVKIKCCKHDARVHLLAQLFRANGISIEKIHVHRTCRPSKIG